MKRRQSYLCSLYYLTADMTDEAAEIIKRRMVWHAAENGHRIIVRKTGNDRCSVWIEK